MWQVGAPFLEWCTSDPSSKVRELPVPGNPDCNHGPRLGADVTGVVTLAINVVGQEAVARPEHLPLSGCGGDLCLPPKKDEQPSLRRRVKVLRRSEFRQLDD